MSSGDSVTQWIDQLKAGERDAVQKLWEAYFERLVALARQKLRGTPRRAADEEDVALSAFDSFCRRAAQGRFPQLLDRDDLWQLLVVLTARKACNLVQHEQREKRGGGRVRHASVLPAGAEDEEGSVFADLIGREPDPAFAAQVAEECRRRLDDPGDEQLRAVAVWKMEGYGNEEIAAKLGRSLPTVERKLALIRSTWGKGGQAVSNDSRKAVRGPAGIR
jgi:DNA-directed RNA polymerase specialized sigma24 family protein